MEVPSLLGITAAHDDEINVTSDASVTKFRVAEQVVRLDPESRRIDGRRCVLQISDASATVRERRPGARHRVHAVSIPGTLLSDARCYPYVIREEKGAFPRYRLLTFKVDLDRTNLCTPDRNRRAHPPRRIQNRQARRTAKYSMRPVGSSGYRHAGGIASRTHEHDGLQLLAPGKFGTCSAHAAETVKELRATPIGYPNSGSVRKFHRFLSTFAVNCDDSLIVSRRLPRTEQFAPGRVTNGDNRGMLQLSLGAYGVELRSYIIGCADCLESFLFSKLGLDDRRQRKYTCTGFSKRS
jgi:hypothetical protein